MNLVINGVEAISGKGEVFIHIHPLYLESPELLEVPVQGESEISPGEYVVVSVSDTGTGIAPEERERIFEPFFTKKVMGRSGTGLGMALVLGTVNDHQGYIRIRSTPGKGTMISLFFPVTGQDAGQEVKEAGVEELKGGQERILVVDDDPVQLNIAEKLLKRLAYRVHCRASGEEGLRFLQQNRVDLVILDIIMEPGMSGVEACERILEICPGQKVLFVTGFSDAGTLDRARELSKSPSLFKPYSLENMGRLVKEKCKEPQSPLS